MSQCTICISLFDGIEPCCKVQCGHIFHTECVNKCYLSDAKCPICFSEITKPFQTLFISVRKRSAMTLQNVIDDSKSLYDKMSVKEKEISDSNKEAKNLQLKAKEFEGTIKLLEQNKYDIEFRFQQIERDLKAYKLLEEKYCKLKKSVKILLEKRSGFTVEQELICKSESEEGNLPSTFHSSNVNQQSDLARRIAKYGTVLKYLLKQSTDSNNIIKRDLSQIKSEYNYNMQKINLQTQDYKKLKNIIENKSPENRIPNFKFQNPNLLLKESRSGDTKSTNSITEPMNISNCICFYFQGKKMSNYFNFLPSGVIRDIKSDFLVTFPANSDKNSFGKKLFQNPADEYDVSYMSEGWELNCALMGSSNALNEIDSLQRPFTLRRTAIQEYKITVPENEIEASFPDCFPRSLQDPLWLSTGYQLAANCEIIVVQYFTEFMEAKNPGIKIVRSHDSSLSRKKMLERNLSAIKRKRDDDSDSVSSCGYNGLGGHETVIRRTVPVFKKGLKFKPFIKKKK